MPLVFLLIAQAALLVAAEVGPSKDGPLDGASLAEFFSSYTDFLSARMRSIPDADLRRDVHTLFSSVEPIVGHTLAMAPGGARRSRLRRIVEELRNIEQLLDIVTRPNGGPGTPGGAEAKADRRQPAKASRREDDRYYYPVDKEVLLTVHESVGNGTGGGAESLLRRGTQPPLWGRLSPNLRTR